MNTVRAAEILIDIESQLKSLSLWSEQLPSEQALSSQQPFCVDTLAFEQWLQFVFLPRMTQMVTSGQIPPHKSGLAAMAEVVYRERFDTDALVSLLKSFDELVNGAS
ncbi:YqcC family protein [Paraferrimonas sedimenticola]|uniref:YqcC-like domain-containing protein n=1 Tax=Paraferrimonas sedimenticola TaxID=375674 RepID=A0AA37VY79_9GAMM|nr:YqcC family protein [Paraferrimonas sedimenticola]GLP96729.1 hypothetical protein GCM10007895_20350 [Paraferrimonas sedimenticola]